MVTVRIVLEPSKTSDFPKFVRSVIAGEMGHAERLRCGASRHRRRHRRRRQLRPHRDARAQHGPADRRRAPPAVRRRWPDRVRVGAAAVRVRAGVAVRGSRHRRHRLRERHVGASARAARCHGGSVAGCRVRAGELRAGTVAQVPCQTRPSHRRAVWSCGGRHAGRERRARLLARPGLPR